MLYSIQISSQIPEKESRGCLHTQVRGSWNFHKGGSVKIYHFLGHLNLIFTCTVKFKLFPGLFMVGGIVTDTARG